MSCNTFVPLTDLAIEISDILGAKYILKEDPRITGGIFVDPNFRGNMMFDAPAEASMAALISRYNKGRLAVRSVADLPASAESGSIVQVQDNQRGGTFVYDPTKAGDNDGGTIFNGWVRQYDGAVRLEWFCTGNTKTTDCAPFLQKAVDTALVVEIGTGTFLFKTQVGLGGLGVPNFDGKEQYNWGDSILKITGTGHTTFLVDTKTTGKPIFTSTKQLSDPTSELDIFTGKIEVSGINFIGVNKDMTVPEHWEMVEGSRNIHDRVFDLDRIYNTFIHHCNFTWLGKVFEAVKNNAAFNEAYSQTTTIKDNHFFHCDRIVYTTGRIINLTFKDNMCEKNYGGIYANDISTARISDNIFEGGGQFIKVIADTNSVTINGNYLEHNIQDEVLINKCQIFIGGNTNGAIISGNCFVGLQSAVLQNDPDYCDIKLPKAGALVTRDGLLNFESNKAIISGNYTESRQLHTSGSAIATGNRSPNWITLGYAKNETRSNYNSASARANHEAGYSFSSGTFSNALNYSEFTQITRPISGYKITPLIGDGGHPSGVPSGYVMIGVLSLEHLVNEKGTNRISSIAGRISANVDVTSAGGLVISQIAIQFDLGIFIPANEKAKDYDTVVNSMVVRAGAPTIIEGDGALIGSVAIPEAVTAKQFIDPETAKVFLLKTGAGRYAMYVGLFQGIGVAGIGSALGINSSLMWQGNINQVGVSEQYGANVALIGYWW